MNIGILGSGNISGTHARAASAIPGVTVTAVYGRNRERVERLARELGARGYTDLDRFLQHRPMDIVAIGTPSGLHATHGIAAAERGLHVIVEKPIDVTVARATALVAAADARQVKLGVFFQDRFAPGVRALKRLVDDGTLGRPLLASARVKWFRPPDYYAASSWRGTRALDGGGALMNQGVHTVDLLLWLLGPVRRVYARTAAALHQIEVEDTAVAVLEFESGALATLEATTAAFPGYPRRIELSGTNGTAIVEDDRLIGADVRGAPAGPKGPAPQELRGPGPFGPGESSPPINVSSPVVADVSGHRSVIEDFIQAVADNRAPACDGREGLRSVALVEAIYDSARRGVAVEMSSFGRLGPLGPPGPLGNDQSAILR
jgi:UDP-N-acetyl-2-amino-2-deoxyglucuronate dehydrogenase